MKFKSIVFLCVLSFLYACSVDSEEATLSGWLNSQGLPDSYKVETIDITELTPIDAQVYRNEKPLLANSRGVLGSVSNLSHELYLDFAFDSTLLRDLKNADSAASLLYFSLIKDFYRSAIFPKDSFPIEGEFPLQISWKLERGKNKKFLDNITSIADSVWLKSLPDWESSGVLDTTYEISLKAKDSLLILRFPSALVDSIRKEVSYCHLQLHLTAKNATRAFRVVGPDFTDGPILRLVVLGDSLSTIRNITAFRMASFYENLEECKDCLVLHAGVFDSLEVEFPSKPIMDALAEFYGDEFPYEVGNGNDVRQAVILAQLTFARDDSQGFSELGQPIQVVVGSYLDSLDETIRRMETYKLNKNEILENGHPNMVFFDGDSLTLQVSRGVSDFINKASDGRTFKIMMRLGYPVLQPKDTVYNDYITAAGDTSRVFFPHFDYARYDFTESFSKPSTLKLWLASKRGDK